MQDALRSFSEGRLSVFYVYLIESLSTRGKRYVGMTADLKQRPQNTHLPTSAYGSAMA
jgi:predicted GIY-YIG superfamily endonuclease